MGISTWYTLFLSRDGNGVEIVGLKQPPFYSCRIPVVFDAQMNLLKEEAHSCTTHKHVLGFLQKIRWSPVSLHLYFFHENNPLYPAHRGEGDGITEHLCTLDSQISFVRDRILRNKSGCVVS
jgi:hypothetical protein